MRKPRIDYFDPNNAPKLKSSMDDLPVIESQKPETASQSAVSSFVPKQDHAQNETNDRTNGRSNEGSAERRKVRHTFDIFADQLLGLREIAIEREKMFGQRVLLGDLVQEALDGFITKERNKK